ncbi:MAG: hypothetical protein PHW34_09180 [Hespellia sp.]|nr:hypothetical protein [Hespellia sp.]
MREFIIQHKALILAALIGLIVVSIVLALVLFFHMHKKKDDLEEEIAETKEKKQEKITEVRKIVTPDGINPNPMSYTILHDTGHDVYIRSFTVDTLPKRTVFAATFPALFNFDRMNSSVFIEPIGEGRASHLLDGRIVEIETNIITAEKNADRNQLRKLNAKLHDAETWAQRIESGDNSLYHVYFLFTLMAESLEQLNRRTDAFRNLAKEKQITISCCYGLQAECYLTGMPLIYRYTADIGPIRSCGLKRHTMDKLSIASIFNHTQDSFFHTHGIIIGRNMTTGMPVAFDAYDKKHNGYNMVFAGMTGTGKSACMKILASRYITKNGYRFVCIDSQAKGNRGEYAMLADMMCGTNYEIKNNSDNVINLFDIDKEEEWSEITGTFEVLRLQDKISNAKSDMMTLIQGNKEPAEFALVTHIERIVIDIITELYEEKQIYENDVESLYESGKGIKDGVLTSGKIKKQLPILTDFYRKALIKAKENKIAEHKKAYRIILDSLKDRVRELNYCPKCMSFFSTEEYEKAQGMCSCGEEITKIRGAKAYYDGQSTIKIKDNERFTNIDISQLPEEERPIARQISLSFLNEQFIKTNATNPKKTHCLGVIADEVHQNFGMKSAVASLDYVARTSRKRLVSLWTATQSLKDYDCCRETEALLKQSAAKFVFKQSYGDRKWVQEALNLTGGQVDRVLELGGEPTDEDMNRKGEVCIVDNGKVCFCKIDYLQSAEAVFVETDPQIIQKMYA